LGPIPNPQSPIPNPQSPIPNEIRFYFKNKNFEKYFGKLYMKKYKNKMENI